jgi:hypothetical protein
MNAIDQGQGYVFDFSKAAVDIIVDAGFKGCFGFLFTYIILTDLPPMGGAIFLATVHLIKAVSTPAFQLMFNHDFVGDMFHNVIAIKGASWLTGHLGYAAMGFSFGYAIVSAATAYVFFGLLGMKL